MAYKTPYDDFHSKEYLDHNLSRHQHLDSLSLPIGNKHILETGAGIGDHTEYLLSLTPKSIHCLEARKENIDILEARFTDNPVVTMSQCNLDSPQPLEHEYDICYCYGLLYHLKNPDEAIDFLSKHTKEMLLLETCVDYKNESTFNPVEEDTSLFSQSFTGSGCRPGRKWLLETLKKHFEHVYFPITQPRHPQFPTNWREKEAPSRLCRAILIASRTAVNNELLLDTIPYIQRQI